MLHLSVERRWLLAIAQVAQRLREIVHPTFNAKRAEEIPMTSIDEFVWAGLEWLVRFLDSLDESEFASFKVKISNLGPYNYFSYIRDELGMRRQLPQVNPGYWQKRATPAKGFGRIADFIEAFVVWRCDQLGISSEKQLFIEAMQSHIHLFSANAEVSQLADLNALTAKFGR